MDRWLLIDGSNANQNIDITPYNISSNFFIGDGSLLTGIIHPTSNVFDQSLNTTDNVTFVNVTANTYFGDGSQLTGININESLFMYTNGTNAEAIVHFNDSHLEVFTINASNITTRNINVTENSTIYLGGVKISASTEFNGKQVVSFTSGNDSEDVFINTSAYLGDGGFLFNLSQNISFINGTITALNFNATQEFFGGNLTADNITATNFFGAYDWIAEPNWLNFNSTYLYFNETHFNNSILGFINNINASDLNFSSITLGGTTIFDWSEVNYTVSNGTILYTTPSFTGAFSVILPETFHFEIAQLTVNPSTTTGNYRFAVYEVGSGETIEADIIAHTTQWSIFKSYPIDNQISINMTNSGPSKTFDITIKYFQNVND